MNASDVIDDRIVFEHGNVQYLACIVPETYPDRPEWGNVSYYAPDVRRTPWDDNAPDVWTHDAPLKLQEAINRDWYDEVTAYDYARIYRHQDPSGIYLVARYDQDRYGGDAITIYGSDDEAREGGNLLLYVTAAQIRANWQCKRITKKTRANAEQMLRGEIAAWNQWANGDVYGYYVLRQVLDDDGETIESEEIASCYGYYGSDEWGYMYSEAKAAAEHDYANREEQSSLNSLALDLFDAASYPEPSMYDVAGAYRARLNAGMEAIGAATRKLREFEPTLEEGEDPMGLWGIMGPVIKEVCNRPIKPIAIG